MSTYKKFLASIFIFILVFTGCEGNNDDIREETVINKQDKEDQENKEDKEDIENATESNQGINSSINVSVTGDCYTALEVGPFDSIYGNHSFEYELIYNDRIEFVDASAKKNASVLWHDTQFDGAYFKTINNGFCEEDIIKYWTQDKEVIFSIGSKSGILRSFYLSSSVYPAKNDILSVDECKRIADEYFRSILDDFDEFEVWYINKNNGMNNCVIYYERKFGSIGSDDTISIGINKESGNIQNMYLEHYGHMSDIEAPDYDIEKVERTVKVKLNKIFQKEIEKYSINYEYKRVRLMKLNDGSWGILYDVDVTINLDHDEHFACETIEIMVVLD